MRIERLPGFLQTYPQEQRKPRTSSSFRRHDPSDLPRTLSCASRWRHGRNSARKSGLSVVEKGPYRLRTGDSFWVSRECYSAVPTFPPYESGTSWWRSRCFKVRRTFTFALNKACIETSTQKPICATQRQAVACRSLSHAAPSSCRPYEVQE